MKKIFFNTIIISGLLLLSLSSQAQQATGVKPPEAKGPILQTGTESKVAVPPSATDKDLHETATKQSSFAGAKPEKAKDEPQPVKAPERQQQLPQTNTMVPPPSAPVKNG